MTNPNPNPQNQLPDADALLFGGGSPAAALTNIGDSVEGYVVGKRTRQATDPKTKELKFWKSGDPVIELIVDLRTNQRDPERLNDDGVRTVYFKEAWKKTLAQVLRSSGETGTLPFESWIRITRSHDEPNKSGSGNPSKHVKIEYRSPADVALNPPAQAAPVQQQAPVQTPVQQQAPAPAADGGAADLLAQLGSNPELLALLTQQAKGNAS